MVTVGDREQEHLYRGEPEREGAAIMLDQHAEEALHRPEKGAVDHEGPVRAAVAAHIRDIELLRQVEVELDGGALPVSPDSVLDFQIDLGAIEGATTLIH